MLRRRQCAPLIGWFQTVETTSPRRQRREGRWGEETGSGRTRTGGHVLPRKIPRKVCPADSEPLPSSGCFIPTTCGCHSPENDAAAQPGSRAHTWTRGKAEASLGALRGCRSSNRSPPSISQIRAMRPREVTCLLPPSKWTLGVRGAPSPRSRFPSPRRSSPPPCPVWKFPSSY